MGLILVVQSRMNSKHDDTQYSILDRTNLYLLIFYAIVAALLPEPVGATMVSSSGPSLGSYVRWSARLTIMWQVFEAYQDQLSSQHQ